ncbi:MAG TPA: PIG-L deacetylase family protein [Ktedonobacteraceae bacterium]|jgi:LmbE family N-acetylglucosaminyl deacetylase|nr:PIG-L deacetylase family protein [Ktedonobacteraceae bacterium]
MSQQEQEQVTRAMAVFAHPDDAEFGCGGTIAKWVSEGIEFTYVVATDGSKGSSDPEMSPDRLIAMRREEQRRAADVLGIKDIIFLGNPDGYLQHTLELRKAIARAIRQYRPQRLITMTPYRSFSINSSINHPDHLAVGDAALAAVYPTARDRLTFPELMAEGLEPWAVREVYVTGTDAPDTWIDIAPTLEKKIEALLQHSSQIRSPESLERVRNRARETAQGHDMEYAECFKKFVLG